MPAVHGRVRLFVVAESHDPQSFGPDFSEKSAGKMPAVHGRVRLFVVAEATTHKAFSSFTPKPRPTKLRPRLHGEKRRQDAGGTQRASRGVRCVRQGPNRKFRLK
jgi:hypothetical protein